MKHIFYIFSFLVLIVTISSCTKVINLDLKDSDPQYVIEGMVNKDDSVHFVFISQSVLFSTNNVFPNVSGAIVTISDNLNNSEVLTEIIPGKYATAHLLGVEGRTYTLTVQIADKVFTSSSTIPQQVNLDTMVFIDNSFGGNGGKIAIPIRFDPAGVQNNYKFDMYVSRFTKNKGWEMDSAIQIQNDDFSDGLITQEPLFGSLGAFMPNDTCKVIMTCIDKDVYKYFYSLSLNEEGGAATPANPISNISGGCLGYFSAQTKQTSVFIVPE